MSEQDGKYVEGRYKTEEVRLHEQVTNPGTNYIMRRLIREEIAEAIGYVIGRWRWYRPGNAGEEAEPTVIRFMTEVAAGIMERDGQVVAPEQDAGS